MALKSTLESAKARLDALLTYANETTGESDTSIGDAIETLCAGYAGGVQILTGIISFIPLKETLTIFSEHFTYLQSKA